MSPVLPIIALGALLALALGARPRRAQAMPLALPAPPPRLPEPSFREPAPQPAPRAEVAPAPAPAPPPIEAPPQTLPELAEKAQQIFTAPTAPPVEPAMPIAPPPPAPRPLVPPRAAPAPAPMVPAQPAPPAPAPEVVFEPSAPAVVVTPPPPIAAVPAVAPATAVPAGFDPDGARRVAPRIAAHLRKKGAANYSRQALREFQRLAGLKEDGLYGGRTAGALRYYLGGANPPAPMFRPLQEVSYSPPGS